MSDDTFRWIVSGAVAISTLCIVIMAIAAFAMYRVVTKLQARTEKVVDEVQPIIETVRKLTQENAHNVTAVANDAAQIAANAKDISEVAKEQAHRYAELGRDFADRAQAQVARVDAAVDETVDQVQVAGEHMKTAVMKPVAQASGILAGVKAAVSTYAASAANGRSSGMTRITQDEEMFI